MKKLISIGVALALLTMVVMPGTVAAQYEDPDTFAKIPFSIIQSGFELIEGMWPDLDEALGIGMPWVGGVMGDVGEWAGGPLAWSVDMLGWGVDLVAGIVDSVGETMGLPTFVAPLIEEIACAIFTPFGGVIAPPFDPCG